MVLHEVPGFNASLDELCAKFYEEPSPWSPEETPDVETFPITDESWDDVDGIMDVRVLIIENLIVYRKLLNSKLTIAIIRSTRIRCMRRAKKTQMNVIFGRCLSLLKLLLCDYLLRPYRVHLPLLLLDLSNISLPMYLCMYVGG